VPYSRTGFHHFVHASPTVLHLYSHCRALHHSGAHRSRIGALSRALMRLSGRVAGDDAKGGFRRLGANI
jgi:hypothetical protein